MKYKFKNHINLYCISFICLGLRLMLQKDQLNYRFNYPDTKLMINVEYQCSSIDIDAYAYFVSMQLQDDINIRIMFSLFDKYCDSSQDTYEI